MSHPPAYPCGGGRHESGQRAGHARRLLSAIFSSVFSAVFSAVVLGGTLTIFLGAMLAGVGTVGGRMAWADQHGDTRNQSGGNQSEAAPAGGFSRHLLALQAEFSDALIFDADGDGLSEIAVIEAERGYSRKVPHKLHVFRQGPSGFTSLDSAAMALPGDVMLTGIGVFRALSGTPTPGLVFLLPNEVRVLLWRKDRFDDRTPMRFPVKSIFPVSDGEIKRGLSWIHDLNGDGISEIIVPGFDRLTLLQQQEEGSLAVHAVLDVPSHALLRQFYRRKVLSFNLPNITLTDVDGKGWRDVAVFLNGELRVFLIGDIPRTDPVKAAAIMDFQPPRPFDPKTPWDPPLKLITAADLNHDGALDLIFSKTSAADSKINSRTTVMVHFGRTGRESAPNGTGRESVPNGTGRESAPNDTERENAPNDSGDSDDPDSPITFTPKPDQVFPSAGLTLPFLLDGNDDRRFDLIIVNVEIGFWNVIKALITRTVNADAAYFPMTAEGRYPAQPREQETYGVTFSLSRFGHQPITAFGDLNGDGYPDLILSVDTDRIGIHWGRPNAMWDDDHDAEWEDFMPLHGTRVKVIDLNSDGREDLIFFYNREDLRKMPTLGHTVAVLISNFGEGRVEPPSSMPPEAKGEKTLARVDDSGRHRVPTSPGQLP